MTHKRAAIGLVLVLMSAALIGAGILYGRSAHPAPPQPSSTSVSSPAPGEPSARPPRAAPASPEPLAAPPADSSTAGSLADILEAEGGQLTDVMAHLRSACALARPARGEPTAIDLASRCAEDAEGAMSLVDLIRGSIEGPAGAAMPGDLRNRWEDTLAAARATVREMLIPVFDATGRDLASGRSSPADFRALGHLRDRIGRVLSAAERP